MKKIIKFVGSVVDPGNSLYSHFDIYGGNILATNGKLIISHPVPLDIDCRPNGKDLIRSINNCSDDVSITLKEDKLTLRSGRYRSSIACLPDKGRRFIPERGNVCSINHDKFIAALDKAARFMPANHPELYGVQLKGNYVYSTNSFVAIKVETGSEFQPFVIPGETVKFLINCKKVINSVDYNGRMATFYFAEGGWVSSSIMTSQFPDIDKMLGGVDKSTRPYLVTAEIKEGIKKLTSSKPDIMALSMDKGIMCIGEGNSKVEYDIGLKDYPFFMVDSRYFSAICDIADGLYLGAYPKPIFFEGNGVQGAFAPINI